MRASLLHRSAQNLPQGEVQDVRGRVFNHAGQPVHLEPRQETGSQQRKQETLLQGEKKGSTKETEHGYTTQRRR